MIPFLFFVMMISTTSLADPSIDRELSRIRRITPENMCVNSISRSLFTAEESIRNLKPFDLSPIEKFLNLTVPATMVQINPLRPLTCAERPRKLQPIIENLNKLIHQLNLRMYLEIERNARLNTIYGVLRL
jgi:hypothetical protein